MPRVTDLEVVKITATIHGMCRGQRGLQEADVDDLIQEILLKVCADRERKKYRKIRYYFLDAFRKHSTYVKKHKHFDFNGVMRQ